VLGGSCRLLYGLPRRLATSKQQQRCLLFDEAFFQDFFVREPQVGDVGGAETKDIFQGAANLSEMEIHANALEQFDERLRAHGLDGLRADTVVVHAMIGDDVNGLGTGAVPVDVEEAPGFGLGRGEPGCYT